MEYVALLTSLPHLNDPFRYQRPPITRVQLGKRLNQLSTDHRRLVDELARIFYWGAIGLDKDDSELVRRAYKALDWVDYLGMQDLHEWLLWRMDLRTVMAALRLRERQRLDQGREATPPAGTHWGYGRYTHHIRQHWTLPGFGLEGRYPWISQARAALQARETLTLEKILLGETWNYYSRQRPDRPYSLPAVWLYLMQWDLVDRWTRYESEQATQRFHGLVEHGIAAPLRHLGEIA